MPCENDPSERKVSYGALPRVAAAERRFRPTADRKSGCSGRVTRPYGLSKQAQSHVVLARQTPSATEGEASPVCVPTSRISERYVVDSLPRELNPFRFRCIARDTAGCVQRPYLPCVARDLRALPPGIHAIMYPNCGARDLPTSLVASSIERLEASFRQADRFDRTRRCGSL